MAFAAIGYAAVSRGVWLDEFWSLRLGATDVPLSLLWSERWASDTHPPLANSLYRLVAASGLDAIPARRLLLNVTALLVFLGTTVFFALRDPGRWRSVHVLLFVLTLSLFGVVTAYADYRSYGWQCTAIGALLQYGIHSLRRCGARDVAADAIGAAAVFAAIALHYVTGLIVSVFVLALSVALWRGGGPRRALRVLLPALAAWMAMLASAAALLSRKATDIDYAWIETSVPGALGLFGFVAVLVVLANPVATLALVRNPPWRAPATSAVAIAVAVAAGGAMALLLGISAVMPIVIERYLIGWQMLLLALVALGCEAALARRQVAFGAVVAVGLAMLLLSAYQAGRSTGWDENARKVAARVATCPATRVYAMSWWRLIDARATNMARRETVVIDDAYRRLAAAHGFAVDVLPLAGKVQLQVSARCPTLLWIEHFGGRSDLPPGAILRAAGLRTGPAADATLSASESGLIMTFLP